MQLEAFPGKKRRGISLTPLIDVVFILLLFFMLSSNFMHWRQITLSSAEQSEQTPDKIEVVRVESDAGRVTHAGKSYQLQDLTALSALVAANPEAVFAVEAAPEVKTHQVRLRARGPAVAREGRGLWVSRWPVGGVRASPSPGSR